jgi:hypothetical protein
MTRRSKRLVGVLIGLPLLAYAGWVGYERFCRHSVETNTLVGRSEAQIRARYGQADKDWQDYQSLGLSEHPSPRPTGAIRTLIFRPGGLLHPEGGTLWVWLVEREGDWICFKSCWFADGVKF